MSLVSMANFGISDAFEICFEVSCFGLLKRMQWMKKFLETCTSLGFKHVTIEQYNISI